MQKKLAMTATLAGVLLSGCATQSSNQFQAFQADDLNELVRSGRLVQKTDTFFVLNDSSSSMSKDYEGPSGAGGTKLDVEKNLLNRLNKTLPAVSLSSGLRSFGFGPCTSWNRTHLNQPLQQYSPAAFEKAISSLECSSGGTPLAEALEASAQDLAAAPGNIALIVLSDGMDDTSPVPATETLKTKFGDRLCIYTVWVGNEDDTWGRTNLRKIAEMSHCGFTTTAADISSAQGMSDYVKKVFFKPGEPDDDQDGVPDSRDKCPDTPKGALVDKDGCWAYHGVLFDFDSDKIKPEYAPLFANAAQVMKLNPGLTVEIQGHTDSFGSDAYNQKLSERRANAAKRELVKQGVDSARMTIVGFGESQPTESNATEEGRSYNRRVVFKRTDR